MSDLLLRVGATGRRSVASTLEDSVGTGAGPYQSTRADLGIGVGGVRSRTQSPGHDTWGYSKLDDLRILEAYVCAPDWTTIQGSMKPAKFESLVRQHKDAVYRQMVRVCGHREDAEDALASALMLAFRSADQLSSDAAFQTWLGTIGRRVCTRMRSHPSIHRALEYADEHGIVDDHVNEFDLEILKRCVRDAVEDLPDIYRPVYVKCELDESTVPEAAAELGISHAAAKSRLLRARAIVRERLDRSVCAP
ncbi:MAG: RNA polymerase sigma factor [Fimbriimonas sp.]